LGKEYYSIKFQKKFEIFGKETRTAFSLQNITAMIHVFRPFLVFSSDCDGSNIDCDLGATNNSDRGILGCLSAFNFDNLDSAGAEIRLLQMGISPGWQAFAGLFGLISDFPISPIGVVR